MLEQQVHERDLKIEELELKILAYKEALADSNDRIVELRVEVTQWHNKFQTAVNTLSEKEYILQQLEEDKADGAVQGQVTDSSE